jgi:hypothetical protein
MLQFLLVARGLSTSFYLLHRILSSLSSYIFLNRHTLRAVISYSLSLLQSSDVLVILCFLTANIRVTLALRRVTHPLIIKKSIANSNKMNYYLLNKTLGRL